MPTRHHRKHERLQHQASAFPYSNFLLLAEELPLASAQEKPRYYYVLYRFLDGNDNPDPLMVSTEHFDTPAEATDAAKEVAQLLRYVNSPNDNNPEAGAQFLEAHDAT